MMVSPVEMTGQAEGTQITEAGEMTHIEVPEMMGEVTGATGHLAEMTGTVGMTGTGEVMITGMIAEMTESLDAGSHVVVRALKNLMPRWIC